MFKISKKTIISGAIGNALEMYDYVIWGLFASFLTKEFLPPQSKMSDIFYLFLITYILRPIGSFFFGILADQLGRKKILTFSIFLMGACTSLVGILPSYGSIGVISVISLVFIRLIQVLSVGGEYISSISLLIESCNKTERGYFGSWAAFGVNAGMLFSSLMGALIIYLIDLRILPQWSWRFAFMISVITMLLGFWIRNSIPESFEFIIENSRKDKRSISEIVAEVWLSLNQRKIESLVVFFLTLFGVSSTVLIYIYSPIQISLINNIKHAESFLINASSLALVTFLIPIFGIISDKIGRIKTLIFGVISLNFAIIPYFIGISSGSFFQVLLLHTVIGVPCACIYSLTPVLITEIFPLSIRCSSVGLIYSLAACLGGGVTPLLAFKISNSYGNYAPAFILLICGLSCLLFLTLLYAKNVKYINKLQLVKMI
jgi:MFS transporter, MHS family, proline/betaine transporter